MKYKSDKNDVFGLTNELSAKTLEMKMPIILGFDSDNNVVVEDMIKMGNILIGGETGSGKSVFLHSLICSLFLRFSPKQCQFFLVDPKQVDLVIYKDIPHLYHSVLTEPTGALSSLQSIVNETDRRLKNNVQEPYLFVIIDTFSDLFYVNPSSFIERIREIVKYSEKTNIFVLMSDSRVNSELYTKELLDIFTTKIAFRTSDHEGSIIILGNDDASKLQHPGEILVKITTNNQELIKGIDTPEEIIKFCISKVIKK